MLTVCSTADLIKQEGLIYEDTDNNPDFTASQLYAEVCALSNYRDELITCIDIV